MVRTRTLRAFCAAGVLLLFASVSASQTVGDTSGGIEGVVTDRTGGALPGVTVRAISSALMGARTSVSAADGVYRIPALPPGEYELTFTLLAFHPVSRDGVRVTFGATTDVSVSLDVKPIQEEITVQSGARLLHRHATTIAPRANADTLAELPGSRSLAAILAETPAVLLTRFDVGGSTAFAMGPFSAYGIAGFNRPTIEGIVVSNLNPLGFHLDYGAFEEVSVGLGAYGPEWPSPGVHVQAITKSGGNQYRGSVYTGYESERWQARNIDADQIARGAASAAGFRAAEANRLDAYRDLNGDIGGFVRKDRLWWHVSARDQRIAVRRVIFPIAAIDTRATSTGGKMTMRAGDASNVIVFAQRGITRQPIRLDAFLRADTAINESEESTLNQLSKGLVWKAEWNAGVTKNMFIDARAGQFVASRAERPNGHAPRFEDSVELTVRGGNRDWQQDYQRDQFNGSLSYFSDNGHGRHHVKAGIQIERVLETETWKRSYAGDVLHILNRGAPDEVYLFQTPSEAKSGQWWYAGYLSDSWQTTHRLTMNIGLRVDRFRIFLPRQQHPAGRFNPTPQSFGAVPNLVDWNVAAPRVGSSYDLTGGGRTILKSSYGLYRLPPGAELGFSVNPNVRAWWERYNWTDVNDNLMWDRGEESTLPIERRGGTSLETLDPELKLALVHEITTRVEREFSGGISASTGVVWRGVRRQGGRHPAAWSFEAFTVATTRTDPGPAGATMESAGNGTKVALYELPAPPVVSAQRVVRNVDRSNSDYLTWEIGADRRFARRWSAAGSFAHTWNRDHAGTYLGQAVRGNALPVTPNDLIHTDNGGRHVFRLWSAKLHVTFDAPWELRVTPFVRHQSGQPFGRTLAAQLNYGTIRVLAEPIGTRRQDHVTLVDVGVQKRISMRSGRHLAATLEIFNALNSNAEQNVNWASGTSFLRPLTIVPPRIVRIGARLDW
jgi:hypothetical protein